MDEDGLVHDSELVSSPSQTFVPLTVDLMNILQQHLDLHPFRWLQSLYQLLYDGLRHERIRLAFTAHGRRYRFRCHDSCVLHTVSEGSGSLGSSRRLHAHGGHAHCGNDPASRGSEFASTLRRKGEIDTIFSMHETPSLT